MQPGLVVLAGVGLLSLLLFVGGVVDVFRVPTGRHRAALRSRRPRPQLASNEAFVTWLMRGRARAKAVPRIAWPRPKRSRRRARPAAAPVAPEPRAPARASLLPWLATAACVAMILGVVVFQGGEPTSGGSPPIRAAARLARQAEARASVGDYQGAWTLYYQGLQAAPEDLALWYGLGVTLSHLGRPKETQAAFEYVVRHGRPKSEEVKRARRWLVSAGVLAEPVQFAPTSVPMDGQGPGAAIAGTVTWRTSEAGQPTVRVQLLLAGSTGAARGKRFSTQTTLGQPYRFEQLPAGTYRLIGAAAGQRVWDLTIAVEDGREIVLDLGHNNSSNPQAALDRRSPS